MKYTIIWVDMSGKLNFEHIETDDLTQWFRESYDYAANDGLAAIAGWHEDVSKSVTSIPRFAS